MIHGGLRRAATTTMIYNIATNSTGYYNEPWEVATWPSWWNEPTPISNFAPWPALPKPNWRWFGVFRQRCEPLLHCGVVLLTHRWRRLVMPRLAERRRQKRRAYLQMLAGAA